MTIEFDCPACAVAIRVPDHAAGKMGKCPQCATRLLVPRPQRQASVSATPPLPEATVPEPVGRQAVDDFPAPAVEEPFSHYPVATTPAVGELPHTSIVTPSTFVRSRRKRRRIPVLGWLIPLLFLGAFGGALFWQFGPPLFPQKLEGDLTATNPEGAEAIAVIIPVSQLSSDAERAKKALEVLTATPVVLTSGLLRVSFEGTPQGLKLLVDQGPETRLYRVDLSQQTPLKEFITRRQQELDADRAQRQAIALKRFTSTVLESSETQQEFASFRDDLGLTAAVKGFGYSVVAESDRTLYPCIAQPDDQTLVFALPPGLTTFQILGRPVGAPPKPVVDLNYRVKVVAPTPSQSQESEKAQPEPSELPEEVPPAETKTETPEVP